MKKSITIFILFCIIFIASCTVEDESLIGTWAQEASWINENETYEGRVEFIFEEDTLEALFYGQDNGWVLLSGTRADYTVEGNIISIEMTEMLVEDVWTAASGESTAQYDISGDMMDLIIDYTDDGIYDDSHPFSETFPSGDGPTTDILFELTKQE